MPQTAPIGRLWSWVRRRGRVPLRVLFHAEYALPFAQNADGEAIYGRRAQVALWQLLADNILVADSIWEPRDARDFLGDVVAVGAPGLMTALGEPEFHGRTFAVRPDHVRVDDLLAYIFRAVGGTVDAAHLALEAPGPVLNLAGGFHLAGPNGATGGCVVNDISVAVRVLRAGGFSGPVGVLVLADAKATGTADWAATQPDVWVGADLPGEGSLPPCDLWFVVAGDTSESESQAIARDRRVLRRLDGLPQVWLPGLSHRPDAWRRVVATARVLATGRAKPLPVGVDPADLDPLRMVGGAALARVAPVGQGNLRTADLPVSWASQKPPRGALGVSRGALRLRPGMRAITRALAAEDLHSVTIDAVGRAGATQLILTACRGDTGRRLAVLDAVLRTERIDETGDARRLLVQVQQAHLLGAPGGPAAGSGRVDEGESPAAQLWTDLAQAFGCIEVRTDSVHREAVPRT